MRHITLTCSAESMVWLWPVLLGKLGNWTQYHLYSLLSFSPWCRTDNCRHKKQELLLVKVIADQCHWKNKKKKVLKAKIACPVLWSLPQNNEIKFVICHACHCRKYFWNIRMPWTTGVASQIRVSKSLPRRALLGIGAVWRGSCLLL